MIDILGWAPSRDVMCEALTKTAFPSGLPLAEYLIDEDTQERIPDPRGGFKIRMADGIEIDEVGPVTKTPGQYDDDGTELVPPDVVGGWHVNFRVTGDTEYLLTAGIDQTDAETGELLSVWERTRILALIPELDQTTLGVIREQGQTGYVGLTGLRLYDPGVVSRQTRIWL